MSKLIVRASTEADVARCAEIYAHHVLHGTGTFDEVPPSVEELAGQFNEVAAHGWSWLVATDATGVLGFAYYAQFRDRTAFRFTAEDRIYVREDVRGQGVGKALVEQLLEAAMKSGFRQMIAYIEASNEPSKRLHEAFGFEHAGLLKGVGFKYGRWTDSILMQRALGAGDAAPPGAGDGTPIPQDYSL